MDVLRSNASTHNILFAPPLKFMTSFESEHFRVSLQWEVSAEGYFAWALQHEIDHLDGILYLDRHLDRLDRAEDLREIHSDDRVEEIAPVE